MRSTIHFVVCALFAVIGGIAACVAPSDGGPAGAFGLRAADDGCPGSLGCPKAGPDDPSVTPEPPPPIVTGNDPLPWPPPQPHPPTPIDSPNWCSSCHVGGLSPDARHPDPTHGASPGSLDSALEADRQPWDCGPHFPLCDPWPTPPVAPTPSPEAEIIVGPNGVVNAICHAFDHYGSTYPSQSKVVPTTGDACSGTTVNEHGAVVTSAACAPSFWAKGQAYPGTLEENWATVLCGGTTPPAVKLKWAAKINGVYPSLGVMVLCGKQMLSPNESGPTFAAGSWAPPIDATEPVGTAYMHSHQPLLMTSTGCSIGSWVGGVGQHTCDTNPSATHELAAGGGLFNDVGGGSVDYLFGFHLGPGQPGRNAVRSAKSLIDAGVFDANTCGP